METVNTQLSRTEAERIWNSALTHIKNKVHDQSYKTWFTPIIPIYADQNRIILEVPSQFFYDWLEGHYSDMMRSVLRLSLGFDIILEYSVKQNINHGSNPSQEPITIDGKITRNPHNSVVQEATDYVTKLNPKFVFDTFIEGDGNKFAKAAALAVAEAPGKTAFNPLVIFGDTGLGKTHLMQAIGNFSKEEGRAKRVFYATSEHFTSDFIKAITLNKTTEFSSFYRDVELLLVDDIQFFENKGKTQEEFFHTFNALFMSGKQIVLTCDRPLSELKGLEERLLSRFQSGLVVDIQPPDFETRVAILTKRTEESGIKLSREILDYLASNVTQNIRELEGALIRIMAQASMTNTEVTLELVKSIFSKIGKNVRNAITIQDIMKMTAGYFGLQENLLLEKTRKKEVVIARQISMYLAKIMTSHTVKSIGLHFGGRDHTTVLYSVKMIEDQLDCDPVTAQHIENLRRKIEQSM